MTLANPPSAMTLGRFVRITLHNLRLLIDTYSGSTIPGSTVVSSMPEANTNATNDTVITDQLDEDNSAVTLPDVAPMLLPAGAASRSEMHATEESHIQPALNLATADATVVLAAETESGALVVRTGETALSMLAMLESLLFVADGPVEATQLARVLDTPVEVVESHLRRLAEEYHTQGRGLRVAERNGRFQMVTAPAAAPLIETFLNLDMTTKLSAPALETLAVVAYRQPVTRAQVEAVRGVDCSGILRSLLQRGLVEEVDRLDAPGRPVRYGVTDLFMQHFGLTGLHELPPLASGEAEQLDDALEREM